MKIEKAGDTLRVFDLKELDATTATLFQESVHGAVGDDVKYIEVDLSGTALLDSCGLGTLVALRKLVGRRDGAVRLINPAPAVREMVELTRLYRVLEVVTREELPAPSG